MSDGGKGSSPRPYSISQEEYALRWDAIFKKDNKKEINVWNGKDCNCHRCIEEHHLVFSSGLPLNMGMMILCPKCGNKRCPKASDHTLECTNSNEIGQEGSI